jgi:simple sugar transport system substrate-binding protein
MPLAAQAAKAGVEMSYWNCDVPKVRAAYGGGYVGVENWHQVGYDLAVFTIDRYHLKPGNQAIDFGFFNVPGLAPRDNGIADGLKAKGLKVTKLLLDATTGTNPESQTGVVVGALAKYPDAKVLSLSGGQWVGCAGYYLKAAGFKPGQVNVIGFDPELGVAQAEVANWAQVVVTQEPFLQGYMTVMSLCLQKVFKLLPFVIDTAAGNYVTSDNVHSVYPLIKAGLFA